MRLLLAVLTGFVLALTSCGGDDDNGGGSSDEEQIRAAIEAFAANEDPCDLLTDTFVEQAFGSRENCQEESEESKGEDPTEIEFKEIEIDGEQATATVEGDGDNRSVSLKKEGDDWRIDGFEVGG